MARRRPRRRPLKEPEEILTLVQRSMNWLKPYLKWFLLGGGVLLLIFLSWSSYTYYQYRRETQAQAALEQVRSHLGQPEKVEEALKALEGLIRDYQGTAAARLGEFYKAHLLFQSKKYEEATRLYEELHAALKRGDPWNLRPVVAESLSYCYEVRGDYVKAAETLKPVVEEVTGNYQSVLLSHLGLLYERAGNPKEAAAVWQRLLPQAHNPALVSYWKEKLSAGDQTIKTKEP